MKIRFQKFILYLIMTLMIFEPYLILVQQTKAADTERTETEDSQYTNTESSDTTSEVSDDDSLSADDGDESEVSEPNKEVQTANDISNLSYPESNGDIFSFVEKAGGLSSAKIVLTANDLAGIKALYYIGANAPDFENDMHELWNNLPANNRPASENDLIKVKTEDATKFSEYVKTALKNWTNSDDGQKLRNKKAIAMVTGLPENQINEKTDAELKELYDSMMESLQIDTRVLKTLVYLVTPKDQGGAGHWRLKVKKIMQFAGRPLSTESDTTLLSNSNTSTTSSTTNCDGLTAAECGQQLPDSSTTSDTSVSSSSSSSESDMTVTEENGDESDGYITGVDSETDALKERNISAHSTGQAIDISEVDDIRCTLIKRRRIGSSTYTAQPASPIKLAWQTTEGYSSSGGNPIDSMGIIKAALNDDVRDLITGLGGDVSSYEGDLSNANLSDVVGIVGKSMFAEILNSPSHNLSGYDASETLKNLGTMYFADYFGLPREIFLNRDFNSIDDIQEIIGEAAIEKRMGLPYGSLSSKNFLKTLANQGSTDATIKNKAVYDLEGTYLNIGQRKLEYEMNLNTGDLDTFISIGDGESTQDLELLIGKRVIEKELNLKQEMFTGNNLSELEKSIGHTKYELMFRDPTYLDNLFHLDPGTSRKLLSGETSPHDYAKNVGATRKSDTLNGLRYFAANDTAYNLPTGTWEGMLSGKRSSFITAGSYTLGRLIGDSVGFSKYLGLSEDIQKAIDNKEITVKATPEDIGVAAMQKWLLDNLNNSKSTNANACKNPETITVPVTIDVQYKKANNSYTGTVPTSGAKTINVNLGEELALTYGLEQDDLFNMFGCAEANTKYTFERIGSKILFYGIANNLLSDKEKAKINLLDTDPQFKIDNSELSFYLTRLQSIKNTIKDINSDWSKENLNDPALEGIKKNIDEINKLIQGKTVDLFDVKSSKDLIRDILQQLAQLKIGLEQERASAPDKIRFLNNTIIDINSVLKAASEILAGKVIQSADSITINQIDTNVLNGSSSSDRGAADNSTSSSSTSIRMVFNLLARRIDVVEFFIKLGCSQAETELGLPENSLYYLIENYEKNGITGIDAFYSAIGQAKIEETFNMPNFYFQGAEFGANMPDFANNLDELYKNDKLDIDNYQVFFATSTMGILNLDNESFLKFLKSAFPELFSSIVAMAKINWRYAEDQAQKANGGVSIVEKTLDDVTNNIDKNNLGDSIRTGTTDLLFRLGLSNTNMESITSGNINSTTKKRMEAIDKKLGLSEGSTQALFLKTKPKLAYGESLLTNDDKKKLEASTNIRTNTLETYLKLLNGEISLSDIGEQGLDAEYNITNPYAQQDSADSCPINYVLTSSNNTGGDFVINERFLEDDSYCINDKKGRHCFKSRSEATRYQEEHKSDRFDNVLDSIAFSLASLVYTEGTSEFTAKVADAKSKLTDLVSGRTASVFTDSEYQSITNSNTDRIKNGGTAISIDLIKKVFSNKTTSPLTEYKLAVGKVAAATILSNRLFDGLGFRIDSSLINSELFYEALSGNFSALYDLGASMVEQYIGEKMGTIRSIIRAANVNTLNCAISQAGATMLGGLLGIGEVSLRGNIINNIGETVVEETLGLPKGSFRGDTLDQVITVAQPINFAVSFKLPMGTKNPFTNSSIIDQDDLATIIGTKQADQIKDATDLYKLQKIQAVITQNETLDIKASIAVDKIDYKILSYIPKLFNGFSGKLAEEPTGGFIDSNKDLKPYYDEAKAFNSLLTNLDYRLFINKTGITARLFQSTNKITPNEYLKEVGNNKILGFGVEKLAESLGLNQEATNSVKTILKDFNAIFTCTSFSMSGRCSDSRFGNYGILYTSFSKIFNFNLDDKANYSPGTFEAIFSSPKHAVSIVLGEESKKLDAKLGLDSSQDYSFYKLFERFNNINKIREAQDEACTPISTQSLYADKRKFAAIISNKNSTAEQKAAAKASYDSTVAQIQAIDSSTKACKQNNRKTNQSAGLSPTGEYLSTALEWTQYYISREIQKNIASVLPSSVCQSGVSTCIDMPLEDIRQLVFHGNITYLEIAATSMTVNYVTNETGDKEAVPNSMRISYQDIKNAYFPDKSTINAAANYATWAYENGETYNPYGATYAYGDLCPVTGNVLDSLIGCSTYDTDALPRTGLSLNSGMNDLMQVGYGCTGDSCTSLSSNYASERFSMAAINSASAVMAYATDASLIPADCNISDTTNQSESCRNAVNNARISAANLEAANQEMSNLRYVQQEAERNVKKAYQDSMQYKLTDQVLWKLDKNVYPGFSRALFKGDASVKQAALARYIKNALISGQIFGEKFGTVDNLDLWLGTVKFITSGGTGMDNFVSTGAFSGLSNYINSNFESWFNITLPANMADGLLLGVCTGNWGNANDSNDMVTIGGKKITTFKGAATGWAEANIFSWVDKQTGLPAGTSYSWYKEGKRIYELSKTYSKINSLMKTYSATSGVAQAGASTALNGVLTDSMKTDILKIKTGKTTITKDELKNFKMEDMNLNAEQQKEVNDKLKESKAQAINGAILALATEIFLQYLHQWLGNTLSDVESQLELTPGSLTVLFDAGVTYGIATAAHAMAPSTFGSVGPAGIYIALVIFVAMNLFGVYKVDLICDADGYYSHKTNIQPSIADISGLGEWNGLDSKVNESMSIKAAQYKARRLINDMLTMHDNPLFADVYPSQIMTGRQEDAEALEYSIQANLCDKIGENVKNGICGDSSDGGAHAGVWGNSQTVAWTHIGF